VWAASPTPPGLSEAKHEGPVERNPVNPPHWVWTYRAKTGLGNPQPQWPKFASCERFSIIFVFFGIKTIFIKKIWVLLRLDNYKTENIEIKVSDDFLLLKDEHNESKIGFETFKNIFDKKSFFTFVISKTQRLRIPKRMLENEEQEIIKSKIKTHYNRVDRPASVN
jgi:hypothetical protein